MTIGHPTLFEIGPKLQLNTWSELLKWNRVYLCPIFTFGPDHASNCNFDPFRREIGWTKIAFSIRYRSIAQQKFLRLFVLFCDIFHIAKNVRKSPKFCCDIDKYRKKRQKGAKIFVALLNDNIIYWQYCITLALMEATDKCYPAILIGLLRSLF